jgi:nicotinamide-nucleotide amidase
VTDLTELAPAAAALIADCTRLGLRIATAESCTGGLIVATLTEIAGASAVVDRAFVTYSNAAKIEMLGVPNELIERDGAVSEAVARAMAEGALVHSAADLAVAVTGIAGPSGGTKNKPVGLVHLAAARRGGPDLHRMQLFPDNGRAGIRIAAVAAALAMLSSLL